MRVYPPPAHVTCFVAVSQQLHGVSQKLPGMLRDRSSRAYRRKMTADHSRISPISKEQVLELARAAGLEPGGSRAETIAARLGAALSELDLLADSLAQIEPAPRFAAGVAPPTNPE